MNYNPKTLFKMLFYFYLMNLSRLELKYSKSNLDCSNSNWKINNFEHVIYVKAKVDHVKKFHSLMVINIYLKWWTNQSLIKANGGSYTHIAS